MNNFLFRWMLFVFLFASSVCSAQKIEKFNLPQLLKANKLVVDKQKVTALVDGSYKAVSLTGVIWLKDVNFTTGSIDVDLRGKDVFQKSFLGIAFHGVDGNTYDAIYFRPFNFQSADSLKRKHAVQYISEPNYPWDRLRSEHPLVYESSVIPTPKATDWFHAHIIVNKDSIIVYVNHSAIASLKVKKLNDKNDGLLGLWNDSLNGDFANLEIKQDL